MSHSSPAVEPASLGKSELYYFTDIPSGRNTLRREIAAAIEEATKTAA